jgi:hypothetical protein
MSDSPIEWWKICFFLRNDIDAPLTVVTGSRPIQQPKWGYVVTPHVSKLHNYVNHMFKRP